MNEEWRSIGYTNEGFELSFTLEEMLAIWDMEDEDDEQEVSE